MILMEPLFQEHQIQEAFGTFRQYLVEKGYAEKQIRPLINAVTYVKDKGLDIESLLDVPIQKFRLFFDLDVEWNEETESDLYTLDYSSLKKKYDTKDTRENSYFERLRNDKLSELLSQNAKDTS